MFRSGSLAFRENGSRFLLLGLFLAIFTSACAAEPSLPPTQAATATLAPTPSKVPTESPTSTTAASLIPTQSPILRLTPTPTAGPMPTPRSSEASTLTVLGIPQELEVTITRVIDGDTFEIESSDGNKDVVRLLAVDSPETKRPNKPNEYAEITDIDCLDLWGYRARR